MNFVHKLHLRETTGSLKKHRKSTSARLFNSIPRRMCYRLCALVPQDLLEEGLVFLGFTKCGQFVVSYSCQLLVAAEHSTLPVYVYKLQWWRFIPNSPLHMVSEVRLFGEEDVTQDLFITFCQWQDDSSKVLVLGQSLPSEDRDSCCQCYMTITSFPTSYRCSFCQLLQTAPKELQTISKCLAHKYAFHTKFELTPPYPPFCPRTQLKIDGVAVVNTGDSIVALAVCVGDSCKHSPMCRMDCSVVESMDDPGSTDGVISDTIKYTAVRSPASPSHLCSECRKRPFCKHEYVFSPSPKNFSDESQKENMEAYLLKEYSKQKSPKSPRVIDSNQRKNGKHGSTGMSSQEWFESMGDENQSNGVLTAHSSSVIHEIHDGGSNIHSMEVEQDRISKDRCLRSPKDENSCDSKSSVQSSIYLPSKSSPLHVSENYDCSDNQVAHSPLRITTNTQNSQSRQASQRSFFSPSNSTSSRSTTDSLVLQVNDSRTVTFSVRKYTQSLEQDDESQEVVEDDLDLAYRSVLPVDVQGPEGRSLLLSQKKDVNQKHLKVVQLTFDVEHYLEEVIGQKADWGHRYVSFTNYDLQILDVCADRNLVVGKVIVLLHAREELDLPKKVKRCKNSIKMYQTSFCFTWNLTNGFYDTVNIDRLTEVNETEMRRKEWKPGHRECALLRRQMFVPQSTHRYINVLTNEAVFKGKSLSMIVSPQHFVAILM